MEEMLTLVRRYASSAWQHRWIGVAAAWAICLLGWAMVYVIPNQYEASARLYVDADAVLTPLLKGLAVDNTVANQLDVLQRTLLSRPNLQKLVSKTDLELQITGPADLEQLVTRLATDIKVTPQTRNIFTIAYRSSDPRLAYSIVQTILATFVESKTGTNRTEMENAQRFLDQQIAAYEAQLRTAEAKRAAFRSKYIDLLPSDQYNGSSRLDAARTALKTSEAQLADAKAHQDALQKELATTPQTVTTEETGAPAAMARDNRLAQAEAQLEDLRLRYTEDFPAVRTARNLVAQLKAEGAGAAPAQAERRVGRSQSNPVYEQLKLKLVDNEGTISSLERQIAAGQKEVARLEDIARSAPEVQAEYTNLNRDYDIVNKNYDELIARREAMRITAASDTNADKIKLDIVDPPQVPQTPVAPKRILLISGVLAFGLFGGIAAAIIMVQFDGAFYTIDDLRAIGLPVAGGISMLMAAVSIRKRLMQATSVAVAVLALCAVYGGLLYRSLKAAGLA